MLYLVFSTLLVSTIPWSKTQEIYYVASDEAGCPVNTTCHDVEYYSANISTLGAPLTDVVFYFMPGTHKFQEIFTIEDAVNVSFQGGGEVQYNESKASWQSDVIFRFGGRFSALRIISSHYVTIDGISMILQGASSDFKIEKSTAVVITNTHVTDAVNSITNAVGLFVHDCANVSISYSSFLRMGEDGLRIQFDELLSMDNNYVAVHHSNFSYNQLAGLAIVSSAENYFPVTIELNNLLLTNNTYRSLLVQMLHCIGTIAMEGIASIGSRTGLFFENTLLCVNTVPSVHVTNSVFEGASAYGIKMLIASNTGIVSFQSIIIRDIVGDRPTGIEIAQRPPRRLFGNPNTFYLMNMIIERIYSNQYSLATSQHAISLSLIHNITIADVTIKNNVGNGLSLLKTMATLGGNITFYNNSAMEGGAIYSESSKVFASQYLNMSLIANRAESYGGAIIIKSHREYGCFFDNPVFKNVSLVFNDNTAGQAGSSIYGNLEGCFSQEGFEPSFLIDGQRGFDAALNCKHSVISSNEYQVYFCNGDCLGSNMYELEIIPGNLFTFEIIVVGEYNGTTPALVKFDSSDFNSSVIIDVPSGSTCVKKTLTLNLANATNLVNFSISVSDPAVNDYSVNPAWLAIHVLPCPVGFELTNKRCECANVLTDLEVACDIFSTTLQKPVDTWLGLNETNVSECIYFANSCPPDYCNESNTNFSVSDPDFQCVNNRHGILCGSCTAESSLLLGSNRCYNCTNQDAAWRVPVVLLGSAIAGISLIALLVGLDLTVSKGTINGLVFFANVLKLYESSFASRQENVIGVLISWLNLDIGIETCFYQGMDACEKVGLQFVFPLYVIALALFFIFLGNVDQWKIVQMTRLSVIISPFAKRMISVLGKRAIPVLATLFLLSYTKLIRTVILIFSKASIQCCDPSTGSCENSYTTWYMDGNIGYFTGCHSVLFSVAVFLSVLILLFTAFLVMFPLLAENKLLVCECRGKWRLKLQPWFDAYGAPYKGRYRFWVGLLILVRCVIALVVALAPSTDAKLTALAWISLVLIMISVSLQVYNHPILNVMEVWYFAGLLMLAYFGAPNSTIANTVGTHLIIITSLFIGLCVVVYSVHIHLNSLCKNYNTCLTRIKWYVSCQERKEIYISNSVVNVENEGSAVVSMDETENQTVSVTIASIDENGYREPQIAEDYF